MSRRPIRIRRQRGEHDCGVACVAMLANVSLDEALRSFKRPHRIMTQGADHTEMRYALKQNGLKLGYELELRGLQEEKRQYVAQLESNCLISQERRGSHWLVWDSNNERLVDPDNEGNEPCWTDMKGVHVVREDV